MVRLVSWAVGRGTRRLQVTVGKMSCRRVGVGQKQRVVRRQGDPTAYGCQLGIVMRADGARKMPAYERGEQLSDVKCKWFVGDLACVLDRG